MTITRPGVAFRRASEGPLSVVVVQPAKPGRDKHEIYTITRFGTVYHPSTTFNHAISRLFYSRLRPALIGA